MRGAWEWEETTQQGPGVGQEPGMGQEPGIGQESGRVQGPERGQHHITRHAPGMGHAPWRVQEPGSVQEPERVQGPERGSDLGEDRRMGGDLRQELGMGQEGERAWEGQGPGRGHKL